MMMSLCHRHCLSTGKHLCQSIAVFRTSIYQSPVTFSKAVLRTNQRYVCLSSSIPWTAKCLSQKTDCIAVSDLCRIQGGLSCIQKSYHSSLLPRDERHGKDIKNTASLYRSDSVRRISLPRLYSTPHRHYSRFVDGLVPLDLHYQPPWKILFFGTDEYSLQHLKELNENRVAGDIKIIEDLGVVVLQDHCPVGRYASNNRLPLYKWPIPISVGCFDVGVVVSFGRLIPQHIIRMFPYGILNVHPSLLPRWRGASPILHTILSGDSETGISIIEIRPHHFDTGPLLLQARYPVPKDITGSQLSKILATEGSQLLMQTLKNLPSLERLEIEQEKEGITYAHKFTLTNARVNWDMQTSLDIYRQYRALGDIFILRSQWKKHHVKLLDMVPPQEMQHTNVLKVLNKAFPRDQVSVQPGIPFYHKKLDILCIKCQDGWVGFRRIVLKKKMTAKAFYNGYMSSSRSGGIAFQSHDNDLNKSTFRTDITHIGVSASSR